MKNNAVKQPIQFQARALCTALLVVLATGAASFAASGVNAFERKGAQALLDNAPAAPAVPLPSELDIPELGKLTREWNALPKVTNYINTLRDGKTVRVAVQEVGTGSRAQRRIDFF